MYPKTPHILSTQRGAGVVVGVVVVVPVDVIEEVALVVCDVVVLVV